MWDTIRVSAALIAIVALAVCCFVGFYLFIQWSAQALARTGWI